MTSNLHESDLREQLWNAIDDKKIGMLGLAEGHGRHMQPMTAHIEPETQSLWFFTYLDTELSAAIHQETDGLTPGMFCIESDDRHLYACIAGTLRLEHDMGRIEKYWGPMTAAWFPEGKRDPRLTMIRFDMQDAHVWYMDKSRLGYLFEIVKANLTSSMPNIGTHAPVKF